MRTTHKIGRSALLAGAAIGLATGSARAQPAAPTPLAAFAAQKLSVMPLQYAAAPDSGPAGSAAVATIKQALDDSLGAALSDRGIGKNWAYAADIQRLAKRNTGYTSNPASLGAGQLRARPLNPGDPAPVLLVSNLRSLIALGDSRFALIPVDLAFQARDGRQRPILRLVLLDGRLGQVVWMADVAGEPFARGTPFGAAEIGALAQRVADLVAAR